MQIFGLTITRTRKSLQPVSSRGWIPWPTLWEPFAGAWQRNQEQSLESSLANPTLYAVITLIATGIAKMRPKLVELDDSGIWIETTSSAFSPVLRKPNSYQTRIDFFEWWMVSKLTSGNTYVLKARDGRGVAQQLHVLDPARVTPLVAPDGSVFYELRGDWLRRGDPPVTVPAREIIHDRMCPLFHPLVGVSPIYAVALSALQGSNIRRQSDLFFSNGSKPGGVLTAPGPISQETAARIKEYWDTNFSGENIGKVAVLGDGLRYEAMAVTAEQSQLVEQLRLSDEAIVRAFIMPRHKVGIGNDPTYQNIEPLNLQYYSDCLQIHAEKIEVLLDEGLELTTVPGRTLGVELEVDDLFRMDTTTLVRTEKEATGLKTVNESRKRLSLPPVPGGDTVYVQQQYFSLESLDRRDELPAPTPPLPPTPTARDYDAARREYQREMETA